MSYTDRADEKISFRDEQIIRLERAIAQINLVYKDGLKKILVDQTQYSMVPIILHWKQTSI